MVYGILWKKSSDCNPASFKEFGFSQKKCPSSCWSIQSGVTLIKFTYVLKDDYICWPVSQNFDIRIFDIKALHMQLNLMQSFFKKYITIIFIAKLLQN